MPPPKTATRVFVFCLAAIGIWCILSALVTDAVTVLKATFGLALLFVAWREEV